MRYYYSGWINWGLHWFISERKGRGWKKTNSRREKNGRRKSWARKKRKIRIEKGWIKITKGRKEEITVRRKRKKIKREGRKKSIEGIGEKGKEREERIRTKKETWRGRREKKGRKKGWANLRGIQTWGKKAINGSWMKFFLSFHFLKL